MYDQWAFLDPGRTFITLSAALVRYRDEWGGIEMDFAFAEAVLNQYCLVRTDLLRI